MEGQLLKIQKLRITQKSSSFYPSCTQFNNQIYLPYMLTDEDVDKLTSVLASKHDVKEIRDDMADLKELVHGLIVSSDALANSISNLTTEYAAISNQLTRHELWIKQIAEKVGLKLVAE